MLTEPSWVISHRLAFAKGQLNYAIETWNLALADAARAQLEFAKVFLELRGK